MHDYRQSIVYNGFYERGIWDGTLWIVVQRYVVKSPMQTSARACSRQGCTSVRQKLEHMPSGGLRTSWRPDRMPLTLWDGVDIHKVGSRVGRVGCYSAWVGLSQLGRNDFAQAAPTITMSDGNRSSLRRQLNRITKRRACLLEPRLIIITNRKFLLALSTKRSPAQCQYGSQAYSYAGLEAQTWSSKRPGALFQRPLATPKT